MLPTQEPQSSPTPQFTPISPGTTPFSPSHAPLHHQSSFTASPTTPSTPITSIPLIRQRAPLHVPRDAAPAPDRFADKERSIRKRLASLDMYQKLSADAPAALRKKTKLGAVTSLLVIAFLVFLVLYEFSAYLRLHREDILSIDKNISGKIDIYLNISFPGVKCLDLSIDTIDAAGEAQIDVQYHIYKHPIDETGMIVQDFSYKQRRLLSEKLKEKYDETKDPNSPYYCGSCGEATTRHKQCCNSCFQVLQQYKSLGMVPPPKEEIRQCIDEVSMKYPGCNMYAALQVNKVAGNFHFAPGRSFSREHETFVHHIHEFNPLLISRFNTSHIVNELSFGPRIPVGTYPLDGEASIVEKGLGLHKYFIKVVPTVWTRGRQTIESYQFSYTKHQQEFDISQGIMLPGIFFVFDMSAIQLTYREYRIPFLHFLVKLCAIVGGVFTVSRYLDRFLHGAVDVVAKKHD